MAKTQIAFGVVSRTPNLIALKMGSLASETLTPSGSNQVTTISAPNFNEAIVMRVATDTEIYLSTGVNPNATSDTGRVLVSSGVSECFVVEPGHKAAIVTA